MELNLLLKSLGGGLIVTCPCCGHQFDYDNEPEHTFSQEVQEAAGELVMSIGRNEARRQIERYRPEIQNEVSAIIDGLSAANKEISTKSIVEAFAYVRCPYCWSRVYRSNSLLIPADPTANKEKKPEDEECTRPSTEKPTEGAKPEDEEKKPGKKDDTKKKSAEEPIPSPSFWASLSAATKK